MRHSIRVIFVSLCLCSLLLVSAGPAAFAAHVHLAPPPTPLWGPDPLFLRNEVDVYACERVLPLEDHVNPADVVAVAQLESQDMPPARRYRIQPRRP